MYPFKASISKLEELYGTPKPPMLKIAARRIQKSILGKQYKHLNSVSDEILYVAAAMILGKLKNAKVTETFVRHDINMYAVEAVDAEDEDEKFALIKFANDRYGLGVEYGDCLRMSLTGYLKCVTKGTEWDLDAHDLSNGTVRVSFLELNVLAANVIRTEIALKFSKVSYDGEIPKDVLSIIADTLGEKKRALVVSGEVPPCMKHCKEVMARGEHLKYNGRLALASFCGKRGMEKDEIVRLFEGSPDFKESVTTSQVSGILDNDLMPYSCEKMEQYGLCKRHDRCGNITNPLSYR